MAAKKKPDPKKARSGVLREANVDPEGLDPEMSKTLEREAARRVGAAGTGVRTVNPFERIFGRKKKKKPPAPPKTAA